MSAVRAHQIGGRALRHRTGVDICETANKVKQNFLAANHPPKTVDNVADGWSPGAPPTSWAFSLETCKTVGASTFFRPGGSVLRWVKPARTPALQGLSRLRPDHPHLAAIYGGSWGVRMR